MKRLAFVVPTLVALSLALPGCNKEDEKPAEKKEEKKEVETPPEPEPPAEPRFDLSGPKPPETSAVLFSVDGALTALACFDKDKGQLVAGSDCAKLVAEGSEVYMESSFGNKALETTTAGTKMSMCGDDGALPTPGLDGGAEYDWAVYPKSIGPGMNQIDPDTWSDRGARLEEAETKAVQAAMNAAGKSGGEIQPRQKASADIDGDGKDELFISAVMTNPRDRDSYLFSGLLMAPGGDLGALQVIDQAKKGLDEVKLFGTIDLNGDGKHELWTGLSFEGGAGERVVVLGDKPETLGNWSCGAGK